MTPESVPGALGAALSATHGTTIVTSRSAFEVIALAGALEKLGVKNVQSFLARFSITLDKRIYLSFTPGKVDAGPSLIEQCATIAHEHTHVAQAEIVSREVFYIDYLMRPAKRAQYEAEAYRTSMEVLHWAGRPIAHLPDAYARTLASSYMLPGIDVDFARKYLRMAHDDLVRHGVRRTAVGIEACRWLDENAPKGGW